MGVDKAPVIEELVDGVGRYRAHPEDGAVGVAPGTQVLDGAQVFQGVLFLLEGIFRGGAPFHLDGNGVDLKGLLGVWGEQDVAPDHQGSTHVLLCNLIVVFHHRGFKNHLEVLEGGAVVQLNKAQGLALPDGLDPAAHCHLGINIVGDSGKKRFNLSSLHKDATFFPVNELDEIYRYYYIESVPFWQEAEREGRGKFFCFLGIFFPSP